MVADIVSLSESERRELEQFRSSHETKVLTIFFSDLVGSTALQVDQGNLIAARLVQQHYAVMRTALRNFEGKEISTAGDSMLIVFLAPADAIKFALTAQQAMRQEHACEPLLPAMRCGVHHGQVVLQLDTGQDEFNDICGVQVSTAARIMSLGMEEQILMSRAVFDDARTVLAHGDLFGFGEIRWLSHGAYRFKGIPEAFEVCEVGEVSFAPMSPPADSGKAWSVNSPSERFSHQSDLTETKTGSSGKRIWRTLAIASAITIAMVVSITLFQILSKPRAAESQSDRTVETDPAKRLAQIQAQLAGLGSLEDDLKSVEKLDEDYRTATNAIFGGQPSQVRSDALKLLARLRNYDLNQEEKSLVSKADAMASNVFNFYPEEIYPVVRQLAEQLSSRRKSLLREREFLQQQQP